MIGWRGELDRSEQTWRKVLETDPRDPEALTGLAQVLSWQGRQTDAESALQAALRANPAYGDARTLLRWVQADLRPSATISAVSINDSDHNRATVLSVDYLARAWWNGAIGGSYTDRSANFAAIDSRADAVNLFARWQPGTELLADSRRWWSHQTFIIVRSGDESAAHDGQRRAPSDGKRWTLPNGWNQWLASTIRRDGAADRQRCRQLGCSLVRPRSLCPRSSRYQARQATPE